jgi:transcription factor S
MFCPKCGSILFPKKDKKGKQVFKCSCGHSDKEMKTPEFKEEITEKEKIAIVDKEVEPYPLTEAKCPDCKHDKAFFWTVQTRASDEPETKFFKCEKCKKVWRDYS